MTHQQASLAQPYLPTVPDLSESDQMKENLYNRKFPPAPLIFHLCNKLQILTISPATEITIHISQYIFKSCHQAATLI